MTTSAVVHRVYEPEALDRAAGAVDELMAAAAVLERHHLDTAGARERIAAMLTAPVSVRCSVCRRRRVVVDGIAAHRGEQVRCPICVTAACDRLSCYAPAAVAIDSARGTTVLCARHGLDTLATAEGVGSWIRLRHVVDDAGARAIHDMRNGAAITYRRRSA